MKYKNLYCINHPVDLHRMVGENRIKKLTREIS